MTDGECEICGGDCSSANPPVYNCPNSSAHAPQPADHRRVQDAAPARPELDAEIPPSALDQPRAWWAETGTAGAGEGCNKPFWLRHEAVAYVQKHGGYVAPLFRRYEAPQPGGVVKVKALEWVKTKNDKDWEASSPVGVYSVGKICGDWTAFVRRVDGDGVHDIKIRSWCNESAAKAAAQADYKRRILSALEPSPSGWDAGAFEAGAKAMREDCALGVEASGDRFLADEIRATPLPTPPERKG